MLIASSKGASPNPSILANPTSRRLSIRSDVTPRQARASATLSASQSYASDSKGLRFYNEYNMSATRTFLDDAITRRAVCFGHGIAGLLALRCGGFWSATRAARLNMIDEKFLSTCPCCNAPVPESAAHMLFDCAAWTVKRLHFLDTMITAIPATLPKDARVALLCGGTAGGEALKSFTQSWWKSVNGGTPLYIRVASFLNSIFKDRSARVWHSSTRSQGPQGGGGPG